MLGTLWPLRRDTARVGWRSVDQARERSRSKELTGSAIRIFFITQVPCHMSASQGRSTWHSDDERDVVCLLELDFSVIVLVQHVITKPSRIRPESVKSPDRRRSRPPESPRSEVPQPCHSCHHARVCPARERSSLHRRQPSPRMLGLALGAALHAGSRAARDHIARAGPARPASNPRCIHDPSRDDVDTRRPAQPPTVPPVPPPRRELRRSAKIPPGAPPWAIAMPHLAGLVGSRTWPLLEVNGTRLAAVGHTATWGALGRARSPTPLSWKPPSRILGRLGGSSTGMRPSSIDIWSAESASRPPRISLRRSS